MTFIKSNLPKSMPLPSAGRRDSVSYPKYRQIHLYLIFSVVIFILSASAKICVRAAEIIQTPDSENFTRQIYTTESGLPQNTATSIVQTRDGYIWVGTFGGLARFDGLKFTVFTTGNTPALTDNRITCLYEDRYGVLWIGTEDGVLMKYQDGNFTVVRKASGSQRNRMIFPVFLDKNDVLWFCISGHLNTYNLRTEEFSVIDNNLLLKAGADTEFFAVRSFDEDADNNLWIATTGGLIRFRDNKFTVYGKSDGLPDDFLEIAKQTTDGRLLVGTHSEKLGFFENGKFIEIEEKPSEGFVFPAIENLKDYYCFRLNDKIYRLKGVELTSYKLPPGNETRAALADNEGNLWIGANLNLTQYKPRYIKTFEVKEPGQSAGDTQSVGFRRIIEDKDGTVLINIDRQLISWKDNQFKFLTPPYIPFLLDEKKDKFPSALARDQSGNVWIGRPDGLFRFENNNFIKLETANETADKNFARTILFGANGKIWSSSFEWGLQEFQNGQSKIYTTAAGLIDNAIMCLLEDRSGVLWIGTRMGLSRLENGKFTNYTTENGLSNNYVRDIYEDADGTLWLGTYGGGIVRYRDGNFVPITSKNGLAEDIASRILIDDQDNFWVLGNQGVYSVSRRSLNDFADGQIKTIYCAVYGIKDGMIVSEGNGGNQPAGWKTGDGRLWFPMIQGGIIIDPPKHKSPAPPVYVESVFLNKKKADLKDVIHLDPKEDAIEINYTAINFTKPEQIKFQYKLEGFDTDWQDAGTRRTAYYQYLEPGSYRFIVRAVTADGVAGETKTPLRFEIRSGIILKKGDDGKRHLLVSLPFNQYWWLYALLVLSLILAVIMIYQKRLQVLELRRVEQQKFFRRLIYAHENERRRIAAELHDSVGQSLAMIKNAAFYDETKSFDAETGKRQLRLIFEQSKQTINEVREITYNLRPYMLEKFGITEAVKSLVEKIALSDILDIYLEIDPIDRVFSREEEMSIYRIIQESLNNVLKHSDASEVKIEIKRSEDFITIKIQDDGRGFDPALLNERNKRAGFGLIGIAERVQMLGGTYSVESKLAEGTTVYVSVKIKGIEKGES